MADVDKNVAATTAAANCQTGAVLVLGGGIAGMQASLDLANGGYLVHMVTDEPSIGGKMAQLDKTFPTNECSMCLLGPKMSDCLSHPNIIIHTNAQLAELTGTAGSFTARVRKKARYVDIDECTACGDCAEACPVRIKDGFNEGLGYRQAVYKLFPQSVPNRYMIDKRGTPPCRGTCPAGTNVQGYVAMVSQGKFAEALEVIHRRLPFAGICGRICHHPCEQECNRGEIDQPLAIASIKRAAADYGWDDPNRVVATVDAPARKERVAVIGGGPAGLTAAYDLVAKGYQVTIFEALPSAGGWLKYGIPGYRLPAEIVQREIDALLAHGIEVRANTKVGADISLTELKQQYDAILVAVGVQKSRDLPLEGAGLPAVLPGVDFLRDIKLGKNPQVGKKVVVIGGGNVAMDVARAARRQGGEEVQVVCLEGRAEMPAHIWEVEEAEDEGVVINNGWGPTRIVGDAGKVTAVEFKACTAVFDDERRFKPQYDERVTRQFAADTVIMAIGQAADLAFLQGEDKVALSRGLVAADPLTKGTGDPRVFACGDVAHGPASVIEAVASAHEAAVTIDRYLSGADLAAGREKPAREKLGRPADTPVHPATRRPQGYAPAEERAGDYREVALGLTREEAMEEARRCLNCGGCCECLQCEQACKKKVIRHADTDETLTLPVGAVVLAPGFETYDARLKGEYGYGRYANVMTSLEFERLLSSTGPTAGHVTRPSDGKAPRKVAFIQCVGSRDCGDGGGAEYCSSICCMYSTKEALIAREHDAGIEPTIFYLDMRSYGKNFDKYVDAAAGGGVRYLRAMISAVKEDLVSGNLFIKYIDEGGAIVDEEFDLVVLAIGVQPPKGAAELMATAGIAANDYGFAASGQLSPAETSKAGVFVAGAFQGPRDIPETVMSASAAAAKAGELLAAARGSLIREKVYPPEQEVGGEEPRIGLFICQCGINIAAVVDVPAVVDYARSLPGVVHCQDNLYTCSQDTLKRMKEIIAEKKLNRVVVASCTIRTHQPLFREMMREAGLNQFYFEMANIRDQCSWVHRGQPAGATEKAKDLVRMAVAKVRHHEPLYLHPVPVVPATLVIGGGAAGLTAALSAANQGYDVYLVERQAALGGQARHIYRDLDGSDVQRHLRELTAAVTAHEKIQVFTNSEVADFSGHAGHFTTTVRHRDGTATSLDHGTVIVATGVEERPAAGYLAGEDARVVTTTAFEELLAGGRPLAARQVVMIQCAGSRTDDLKYCSRTCCSQAVKTALQLKERQPETDIFILYRDIRTYGFRERYYQEARAKGIRFLAYTPDRRSVVSKTAAGLTCEVYEPGLKATVALAPDLVVLSSGTVPAAGARSLATMLKVPVNEDGFFVETHAKLGPMDFPSQGIYLCGGAHGPKALEETIFQAEGAVARAATILAQKSLMAGGIVATVDQDKCAACLTCVRICPYNVPGIDDGGKAYIEPVQCHGCGSCAGECPNKAIQLPHYKDNQVLDKIRGLFVGVRP